MWGDDGHSVLVLELDAVIVTVELDRCHGDVDDRSSSLPTTPKVHDKKKVSCLYSYYYHYYLLFE